MTVVKLLQKKTGLERELAALWSKYDALNEGQANNEAAYAEIEKQSDKLGFELTKIEQALVKYEPSSAQEFEFQANAILESLGNGIDNPDKISAIKNGISALVLGKLQIS